MPNGKTHDKITLVTTPIVAGVGFWVTRHQNPQDLMFASILTLIITGAYFFASTMFNGDLDTNSRPYNRWFLLKMIWIPYQLLFTHRSIWTHGIIIGTVVRLIYLSPLIILFFKLFNLSWGEINWAYVFPILIGLELGNSVHTISDKI